MKSFLTTKAHYFILTGIILLAAFLIFFRLDWYDVRTDEATYSFRALGYLDYMDSNLQTTPLDWFEEAPAWSKLSFHDAPPLVFLIQNFFFKLFGDSVLVMRLPFALAGLGSIILVYLFTSRLYGRKVGLLAAGILSVLAYHTWASRVGYLEGAAIFFVLLSLYFFLRSLENHQEFVWFGIVLGLTLLTKYTVFFVLPALGGYLLWQKRSVFKNRYFWLGILAAVIIFSPVIFYNYQMYETRGHFDLQFAQLFGQDMSDWAAISSGDESTLSQNFFAIFSNLRGIISPPLGVAVILALGFLFGLLLFAMKKNQGAADPADTLLALLILFLALEFILIGPVLRLLSLYTPFLAIVLAVAIFRWRQWIVGESNKTLKKALFGVLAVFVLGFELFYNINTNALAVPIGQVDRHYSSSRFYKSGFSELENFLAREADLTKKIRRIDSRDDLQINAATDLAEKNLFVYDPSINWFSALWYFRRHTIYRQEYFFSATDIAQALPDTDWVDYFSQAGVQYLYYILAQHPRSLGSKESANQQSAAQLAQIFEAYGAEAHQVYGGDQELLFSVYKLKLN